MSAARMVDIKKVLEELCAYCACGNHTYCEERCIEFRNISNLPAFEAERIHYGWWRETEDGDWECTSCKNAVTICVCGKDRTYRMERCPHCGARMAGGKKYGEELSQ